MIKYFERLLIEYEQSEIVLRHRALPEPTQNFFHLGVDRSLHIVYYEGANVQSR